MLPGGVEARLDQSRWTVNPVFTYLVETGNVEPREQYRAFNMGIGMVLAVRPDDVDGSARGNSGLRALSARRLPGSAERNVTIAAYGAWDGELAMAMIDLDNKQIVAKIVIYGPGESGKTTFLRAVHDLIPERQRYGLTSIENQSGRTVLYDNLPIDAGKVGDYRMRFLLFSVAGNEGSEDARNAVLSGSDGVVFLADAQPSRTGREHRKPRRADDCAGAAAKDCRARFQL